MHPVSIDSETFIMTCDHDKGLFLYHDHRIRRRNQANKGGQRHVRSSHSYYFIIQRCKNRIKACVERIEIRFRLRTFLLLPAAFRYRSCDGNVRKHADSDHNHDRTVHIRIYPSITHSCSVQHS